MVVVGVPAPRSDSTLFGPIVDGLIRDAPCDVFIISSRVAFTIDRVKRIVVPFTGKESARAAGDLATALAAGIGASVVAINVVREIPIDGGGMVEQMERRKTAAVDAMNDLRERAERLGVSCKSVIRHATIAGQVILEELAEPGFDLCILGANDESRHGMPFFGDTAEVVLRHAPTPVGLLVVR
jgi:nucleotide-binding universal stress UspA family protein